MMRLATASVVIIFIIVFQHLHCIGCFSRALMSALTRGVHGALHDRMTVHAPMILDLQWSSFDGATGLVESIIEVVLLHLATTVAIDA